MTKREAELAAEFLRKALSAEPDYSKEGNEKVCDVRYARAVRVIVDRCERGVLVGPSVTVSPVAKPDDSELDKP